MKVYPPRDIRPFVMYCVNGKPRSSLLIESTDSMIGSVKTHYYYLIIILNNFFSFPGVDFYTVWKKIIISKFDLFLVRYV